MPKKTRLWCFWGFMGLAQQAGYSGMWDFDTRKGVKEKENNLGFKEEFT